MHGAAALSTMDARPNAEENQARSNSQNDQHVQISVAELISKGNSTAEILLEMINSNTILWPVVDEIVAEVMQKYSFILNKIPLRLIVGLLESFRLKSCSRLICKQFREP